MNREQAINYLFSCGFTNEQVGDVVRALTYEPTTKNNLGVDCIDREELLKAVNTWDKFGRDADTKLVPYQDHYIPYIHYDDVIKCIKSMPSVTPLSSELEKNSKKLEKDFGELDCISRADAIRVASGYCHPSNVAKELAKLPSMGRYDPYTDKFIKE